MPIESRASPPPSPPLPPSQRRQQQQPQQHTPQLEVVEEGLAVVDLDDDFSCEPVGPATSVVEQGVMLAAPSELPPSVSKAVLVDETSGECAEASSEGPGLAAALRTPSALLKRGSTRWRWRDVRFSELTAQRYAELRVWPHLSERMMDGRRWLRLLHALQTAILCCTLLSTVLAVLSLVSGHLPPSTFANVCARATQYVPSVLAAGAFFASFIEAEQLPQRARGCDATQATLERMGRWFESIPAAESTLARHRSFLVDMVEQAFLDELAAFAEVASDRRKVQARAVGKQIRIGRRAMAANAKQRLAESIKSAA